MSLLKFALLEDFVRKWIGFIKISIICSLDYRKPCPRKSINFLPVIPMDLGEFLSSQGP